MNHFAEDDLIAYQMGEFVDSAPARTIAAHLEQCPPCASLAEEIARTLRVFSADPAPLPNVDHAWQRLLVNLPALHPDSHSSFRQPATQSAARLLKLLLPVLAVLLVAAGVTLRLHTTARPASRLAAGPLTEQPGDPLAASASPQSAAIAAHLDDAERLLTTVSHEPGAMDPTTHAQARRLLLQNAVYVHQALADGDLPEASVLEDLGRTLTTLEHERDADKGWRLRMELNASDLLLDIRILQQNTSSSGTAAGSPR